MSTRTIERLRPYPLSADFSPPPADAPDEPKAGPDRIAMTPEELATIAATLRAEGAASAQARLDQALVGRVETAIVSLNRAVERLGAVADLIDQGAAPDRVAALARQAAKDISDGQGDLFAAVDAVVPNARTMEAETMAASTSAARTAAP